MAAFYTVEAEAVFTALLATAIAASLSRQTPGEDSPDPMDVRRALQLAQEIAERVADDGGPDLLDILRALETVAEITNRVADDEEDEEESEGEEATPPLPDLTQPDQDPDEEDPDEDPEDDEEDNDIFRRPDGVPEEWVEKISDKGEGKKYIDPNNKGNDVRIQRGNPESNFPSQRNDYVKWKRNGQWLDKNGNPVLGDSPEAHIPFEEFNFDAELFK